MKSTVVKELKTRCSNDVFGRLNTTSHVGMMFLEVEMHELRSGSCSYKLNCQKMVERTYLGTCKQQTR